jgi:hypothetical protein
LRESEEREGKKRIRKREKEMRRRKRERAGKCSLVFPLHQNWLLKDWR